MVDSKKIKPVVEYPIDGVRDEKVLLEKADVMLQNPDTSLLIAHVKLNDAVHGHKGPEILAKLRTAIEKAGAPAGIFLDLKLADTKGTNANILSWYLDVLRPGDVVTVRSSCSAKSFRELRDILPVGVKIALVSMLTDTGVDECRRRHGSFPWVKILNDMVNVQAEYEEQGFGEDGSVPFDAVVCSPLEIKKLKLNFPDMDFIVPGIRDVWMAAGQQARFTGVFEALDNGATSVVMGSQLNTGNPKEGVSAEESVLRTVAEVGKYFKTST